MRKTITLTEARAQVRAYATEQARATIASTEIDSDEGRVYSVYKFNVGGQFGDDAQVTIDESWVTSAYGGADSEFKVGVNWGTVGTRPIANALVAVASIQRAIEFAALVEAFINRLPNVMADPKPEEVDPAEAAAQIVTRHKGLVS